MIFFMAVGTAIVHKAFTAWAARDGFTVIPGQVVDVQIHTTSTGGHGFRSGSAERVMEVVFSYQFNDKIITANTFSPLCTQCPPAYIRDAIQLLPPELTPGTPLRVYVYPEDELQAYLAIPSLLDIGRELLLGGLFLIVAPVFCWLFTGIWERSDEDDPTVDPG